jgi:hypothetical protein
MEVGSSSATYTVERQIDGGVTQMLQWYYVRKQNHDELLYVHE